MFQLVWRKLSYNQSMGKWIPRAEVTQFSPGNDGLVTILEYPNGFRTKFKAVEWLDDSIRKYAEGKMHVFVHTKLQVKE